LIPHYNQRFLFVAHDPTAHNASKYGDDDEVGSYAPNLRTQHSKIYVTPSEDVQNQEDVDATVIPGNAGAIAYSAKHMSEMYLNPKIKSPHSILSPRESNGSIFDLENSIPSVLRLQSLDPELVKRETLIQEQTLERLHLVRQSVAKQHEVGTTASLGGSEDDKLAQSDSIHKFEWPPKRRDPYEGDINSFQASRKKVSMKRNQVADDIAEAKAARDKSFLQDWEVVTSVRANDVHPVTKYRSKSTGFEVVHAQIVSPTVHAYIVIG